MKTKILFLADFAECTLGAEGQPAKARPLITLSLGLGIRCWLFRRRNLCVDSSATGLDSEVHYRV